MDYLHSILSFASSIYTIFSHFISYSYPSETSHGGITGHGGSVHINAGEAKGFDPDSHGGSVYIAAGRSYKHGGELSLVSGPGENSGSVVIASSSVGNFGTSGTVTLTSGSTNGYKASSGEIMITSGNTKDHSPGKVELVGGNTGSGKGGNVNIAGGDASSGHGGDLSLRKSLLTTVCFSIL